MDQVHPQTSPPAETRRHVNKHCPRWEPWEQKPNTRDRQRRSYGSSQRRTNTSSGAPWGASCRRWRHLSWEERVLSIAGMKAGLCRKGDERPVRLDPGRPDHIPLQIRPSPARTQRGASALQGRALGKAARWTGLFPISSTSSLTAPFTAFDLKEPPGSTPTPG